MFLKGSGYRRKANKILMSVFSAGDIVLNSKKALVAYIVLFYIFQCFMSLPIWFHAVQS